MAAARVKFQLDGSGPLFALNAGAEYGAAKRWPAERFVEAAAALHARTACRWVLLGGRADVPLAQDIATQLAARTSAATVTSVAGQTSLRELCAVLKACALVITNDTGPMHVAAALGTPVVVPFGSTSPELTGPLSAPNLPHALVRGEAPCAPCFLRECPVDFRCMKSISAQQIVEAASAVWRGSS